MHAVLQFNLHNRYYFVCKIGRLLLSPLLSIHKISSIHVPTIQIYIFLTLHSYLTILILKKRLIFRRCNTQKIESKFTCLNESFLSSDINLNEYNIPDKGFCCYYLYKILLFIWVEYSYPQLVKSIITLLS